MNDDSHFWASPHVPSVSSSDVQAPPVAKLIEQCNTMMNTSFSKSDVKVVDINDIGMPPSMVLGGVLALQLKASSDQSNLAEDLVFKEDSVVFLDGAGRTLQTGRFQLKVRSRAKLCIYNLNLVDGTSDRHDQGTLHISDAHADVGWVTFRGITSWDGAGIMIEVKEESQAPVVTITNSSFIRNSAIEHTGEHYGGGAICVASIRGHVTVTIKYCLFQGNRAPRGGAIHWRDNDHAGSLTILHSFFEENSGDEGSGIYIYGAGAVTILHTLFVRNIVNKIHPTHQSGCMVTRCVYSGCGTVWSHLAAQLNLSYSTFEHNAVKINGTHARKHKHWTTLDHPVTLHHVAHEAQQTALHATPHSNTKSHDTAQHSTA